MAINETARGNTLQTVTRTIEAPAKDIFRVLTLPTRHSEFDGSGMVRADEKSQRIQQVGERVPLRVQAELWDAYCQLSDEPLCGLRLGLSIQIGHLDSVGMLLVTCDTLGEALQQLVEYAPLVGDGVDFQLRCDSARAFVEFVPHLAVRRAERVEAVLQGVEVTDGCRVVDSRTDLVDGTLGVLRRQAVGGDPLLEELHLDREPFVASGEEGHRLGRVAVRPLPDDALTVPGPDVHRPLVVDAAPGLRRVREVLAHVSTLSVVSGTV